MSELREHTLTANGIEYTVQLTDEDAKGLGIDPLPGTVREEKAKAPANKSAKPANK